MGNDEMISLLALAPVDARTCEGEAKSCLQRVEAQLKDVFNELGYSRFVFSQFPTTETDLFSPDRVLFTTFDDIWLQRYVEQGYDQIDPLFSRCLMPSSNVYLSRGTWEECMISAIANPLGETQSDKTEYIKSVTAFFKDADRYGYKSGVIACAQIGDQRINLSLASDLDSYEHDKLLNREFWAKILITLYTAHQAIIATDECGYCHRGVDININLTPAEAQWFQAILDYPNHTLEQIASLLGRSINTGNTHIRNVKERLGITIKTPLLAQALKRSKKL